MKPSYLLTVFGTTLLLNCGRKAFHGAPHTVRWISLFLISHFSFLILSCFSFAQDAIPTTFFDANGNVISNPEQTQSGLWQQGSGNYEHGVYNSTAPMPDTVPQPSQGMVYPFRPQQEHSPGGKNSYFSSWGGNEITTGGTPEAGGRTEPTISSDARNGVFQKITGSVLWSPRSGSGEKSLGFTQIELNSMFAFPMFTRESPLLVTPGFSTWLLDQGESRYGDSLDLYAATCNFHWIRPLFSQYALTLGATPGYHSAFKYSGGNNGFRIPAHIGAIWNYNPRTRWILGCTYLDRIDYNWMPFGGLIWEPDDLEMRFELLFPNPKIAKRIRWWGSGVGNDTADWVYAAGEWAGDCWSLKDDAGRTGSIAYRDYRLILGYERKAIGCLHFAVEVGGLFARKYRDSISDEDHSIDPGFFLRVKAMY